MSAIPKESELIRRTSQKLYFFLLKAFGLERVDVVSETCFRLKEEPCSVSIAVVEGHDSRALIRFEAGVAGGVLLDNELQRRLLALNRQERGCGAFALDSRFNVVATYVAPGATLDFGEMRYVLGSLCDLVGRNAQRIVEEFGGYRIGEGSEDDFWEDDEPGDLV